ncbi:LCP family protein [Streptomyces boluensis]|uniref:LytR family transcriptional regulator n=1 Tax=Streptomyces boluensis TaxID=1775135 RepID=A0A964XP02_9ACTN|nr:LCP family protein [Streptomyces boluensis]NBE56035.1 LytR family transcriptional regulator [Streptomyces boluensis]
MHPTPSRRSRHARRTHRRTGRRTRRRVLRYGGGLLCAAVVLGGLALYQRLDGNLATTDIDSRLGSDRPPRGAGSALNLLVLGSDSRAGANRSYGSHISGARSDTALLVHLADGRKEASVISVPRDTIVDRPPCPAPNGGSTPAASAAMFNTAYSVGGSTCTVKTLEAMSGVRIDHVMEVDFTGFKDLVDAVGGVRMSIPEDIHDPKSDLDLTQGTHRLRGEQALALVRTRYGVGDGSDLGRIELQQKFLAALTREFAAGRLVADPVRLYKVADAATSALTTDKDLGSVRALTGLARTLGAVEPDAVDFRTLPVRPWPKDPNRVVADTPAARDLWKAIRRDTKLPPAQPS